jgi:hypothetical protein
VPVAIELDGDAPGRRLLEDPVPIRRDAPAAVEHAPARMPEDRDAPAPHGAEHARGLIFRTPQQRVRRRDDELEDRAFLWLQIELSVGEDVGFYPFEDAKSSFVPRIQRIDFGVLAHRIRHAHAARDREAVRVIGDSEARVPERHRSLRHGRYPLASVAPCGVHLEVTAEVRTADDSTAKRSLQRALHDVMAEESIAELALRKDL